MKNFFKKPISKWEIGLYVLILVIVGTLYFFSFSSEETPRFLSQQKEKKYHTINPQISKTFSTQKLIGRVHSNTSAMIHPRREGIIRDILVDVGDEVLAGQVVAYLLPRGVEGLSQSLISKKKAELESAKEALGNAKIVANEEVENAQNMFEEHQTTLRNILIGEGDTRSRLKQVSDEAEIVATQIAQDMRRLLLGTSNKTVFANHLIGIFNNRIQEQKVLNMLQSIDRGEHDDNLLNFIEEFLSELEVLYRTAQSSQKQSEELVSKNITKIQTAQTRLLKAKEKIDNVLLAAEQLETKIESAKNNIDLSKSKTTQLVDSAENKLEISRTAYMAELTQSGHEKVISPFNGTIATRLVEVGHMIMPNHALFEVLNVDTSLGQTAITEVRFGLPEEMKNSVSVGDEIEVSFPFKNKSFPAHVIRKSEQVDSGSHTILVQAVIESSGMAHNEKVFVHISENSSNPVFEIPSTSIKRRRNENFVWVLMNGTPKYLNIKILAEDGEWSDVRGDLFLTDELVTNPSVSLFRTSEPVVPNPDEK